MVQQYALSTYLAQDRRRALARNENLPDRALGSALLADISGFTPLTERLAQQFGARRGIEELTNRINAVYDALIRVVEQHGGRYVREGRWSVPARIELRTQECQVTLDFTHAVITSNLLRIDTDMVHGKLFIVSSPGIVIDTDGLNLTYSKVKLHSKNAAADPRLRIELVGKLLHAKVIEQRP